MEPYLGNETEEEPSIKSAKDSVGYQSSIEADGGEGLAKRKGAVKRGAKPRPDGQRTG
jgi:hypothetical protein